jgi:glycosyltransferase involved in cell wall biosynthesis
MASQLGVESDVEFVPATGNPFPYMAGARTLILPSLWEGSANVLLEAMACNTPVVASRTAGDAEHVLGSGKFGLLVDPRDIEQLAAAILRQVGPDPVRPGARAENFSRAAAMRRYVRLFDRLADGIAEGRSSISPTSAFEVQSSSAARA